MSIINEALKRAQNNLSKQEKPSSNTDKINKNTAESTISNLIKTTRQEKAPLSKKKTKDTNIKLIIIFFLILSAFLTIIFILMKKTTPQEPQLNQQISTQQVLPQKAPIQQILTTQNSNVLIQQNSLSLLKSTKQEINNQQQLVLSGITFADNKGMAIINNEIYEENEFVAGYKIKKIEKKTVTLVSPKGKELQLSVKRQQ